MVAQWDPNPTVTHNIEVKRSAFALLYLKKVDNWLESHNSSHKMFEIFKNVKATLCGNVTRLNLIKLEHLENFLKKIFDTPRVVLNVDLTNDDDDQPDKLPQQNQNVIDKQTGLYSSRSPSFSPEASLEQELPEEPDAVRDSQNVTLTQSPYPLVSPTSGLSNKNRTFQPNICDPVNRPIPRPKQDLPSPTSMLRSLPTISDHGSNTNNCSSSQPSNGGIPMPKRRKSISKPSSDLPSIAAYKIRHQPLASPSVYAKPRDPETEAPKRNIITVPYKHTPRPKAVKYDPVEEAMKLVGIKEKIYAGKYLNFDIEKKKEMQEDFIEREKKENSEGSTEEIDSLSPRKQPKRRKSVVNKRTRQKKEKSEISEPLKEASVPERKLKRLMKQSYEGVASTSLGISKRARSKSICVSSLNLSKPAAKRNIKIKVLQIFASQTENDQPSTSKQSQVSSDVQNTSLKVDLKKAGVEKAAAAKSLAESRSKRSKSMHVNYSKFYSTSDDDTEVIEPLRTSNEIPKFKTSTFKAAPASKKKDFVVKSSAKNGEVKNGKRGRPAKTIFKSAHLSKLEAIVVKVYNNPDLFHLHNNLDLNTNEQPEDEDLLVETESVTKVPRRTTIYVPKRRNATDTITSPPKIKEELEDVYDT